MSPNRSGQWIGHTWRNDGAHSLAVLNLEPRRTNIGQLLSTSGIDTTFRTCSYFAIRSEGTRWTGEAIEVHGYNPSDGQFVTIEEMYRLRQAATKPPSKCTYEASFDGDEVNGTWADDLGKHGSFRLSNTTAQSPRKADAVVSWSEFKGFVEASVPRAESIYFRGQGSSRDNVGSQDKLRSSLHRCNRYDMVSYRREDVPRLLHHINAISSYRYRDTNPDDLGALLSLAQHHGFPTPLLDWTLSPYVAAFFAFDKFARKVDPKKDRVRVFMFDARNWHRKENAPTVITDPLPNVTFLRLPAYNNPRYVPQQSIAAFTSVDDVEGFVGWLESERKTKYLTVIDMPVGERTSALSDLRLMGITAASLFPGFDGVCRSLRATLFE